MDINTLEEIGLSRAEIIIYKTVLERGSITATEITSASGLQSSVVYNTLPKLLKRGFITYVQRGRAKYYQTSDPQSLLDHVDEKRRRIKELIPHLLSSRHPQMQQAEVYLGFRGWKQMLYSLIRNAKPGDEYLFMNFYVSDPGKYKDQYEFYVHFEKERRKRGIVVKGIAHENSRRWFEGRDMKNISFTTLPLPANITVFQDCVAIEPAWGVEQVAFLIRSKELADGFRRYWQAMRKLHI